MAATSSIVNARKSYSIENNNEVQTLTFKVTRTSGSTWWQDPKTLTFRLTYNNDNGSTNTLTQSIQFNFPSGSVGYSKSASVDFTVPHKTDGTQSISYEASITTGTSAGTLHPTGSATLETIPRASSITVNDANIGSGTTITINRASKEFTTTLRYRSLKPDGTWTDWSNPIVTKWNENSYGWTVPTSLYSLIPDNPYIVCEFEAKTYSGDTQVGNPTYTRATFTATGSPVINSCYLKTTDSTTVNLVGDSRMIRYISTVQATVSASARNSASIRSIVVNGVTANSSGVATFPNANTYSYTVTVTDSRGYTATGTYGITWTDYISLTCNATVERHLPTDGIVNLNISGNYFNGSFRKWDDTYVANTLTVQYRYTESSKSTWDQDWTSSGLTVTPSGNTYTATAQLSNKDYTKSYKFEVRAIDRVSSQSVTGLIVSKGEAVLYWRDEVAGVNGRFYVNGKQAIGGYNLDLSSLSTSNFYPVTFNCERDILDCEIHSKSYSSSEPYNQNVIHYMQMAAGWSDTPRTLKILDYSNYDDSEITIGCIGYGTSNAYEHVVWLRGGLTYVIYSNFEPWLHTSDYTTGNSTFTVGTNYYGGSNTYVDIQFTPQETIKNGAYFSDNLCVSGYINNRMCWTDSTTNSLANFKNHVLSGSVKVGTTIISCIFNGSYQTAIVEKANSNYVSFLLFNYYQFKHYRYDNGTWYDETLAKTSDIPTDTTGTSGIWTYIKFGNGYAICWGVHTFTTTFTENWTNGYLSGEKTPPDFPFTFAEVPTVIKTPANPSSSYNYSASVVSGGANSGTTTTFPGKYALYRGSSLSTAQNFAVSIVAFGRWR